MATAATSTSREANFLDARLRSITPALPVYRDLGATTARHIVYTWQGGSDTDVNGSQVAARGTWLCYVSQPVSAGSGRWYIEDLEDDADRMHDALVDASYSAAVNGRFVQVMRRDTPHELAVHDGATLTELQLGGFYVVFTYLT